MWSIDNEWWMRTAAFENENFVAFVHPNVAFVADPKGAIVAKLQTNRPAMLIVDLDLNEVTENMHIKDRRPELYKELTVTHTKRGSLIMLPTQGRSESLARLLKAWWM
jgi:hypothetical protein